MFSPFRSCFVFGVCALATALAGSGAMGADPHIKVARISPSPAPVPALKYRLLPLESELTPGDAAPIYLRLISEVPAEKLRILEEKPLAWLALPLDRFPAGEASKFVDEWRTKLAQIEYGAHRATCQWNYTMAEQQEQIIDVALPDTRVMRTWARLVALKARVEIAAHRHDEAARTIQTGMSFSRHVGDGPFLINALVGVACAELMLDRVDELLSQPGAANLYWSLTALPRPLIGLRRALANEYKMFEWIFPEMTDLGQARTETEWASRLARFHGRLLTLAPLYKPEILDPRTKTLADFRQWVLPEARIPQIARRQDRRPE